MRWRDDLDSREWDVLLGQSGGHPLQSALWGEAKRAVYGISDQRMVLYIHDKLVALLRVENRGAKYFFKLGWIPQGPVLVDDISWNEITEYCANRLRKMHYGLFISSPWVDVLETTKRKTIWIDLCAGKENLWINLDKQWRYGVSRATRLGVRTHIATTPSEVDTFYKMCISLGQKKDFFFQHSVDFLLHLFLHGNSQGVDAKLFLSQYNDEIAAGAFILRSGKNIHYLCGVVDRKYAKERVGEFLQWSVIEWGCNQNCDRYDLEGIDEHENSSVAAFKKKMGGEIINLQNLQYYSLSWKGRLLSKFIRRKLQCV